MDAYRLNVHCERNVPLPLPIATNHPDPARKASPGTRCTPQPPTRIGHLNKITQLPALRCSLIPARDVLSPISAKICPLSTNSSNPSQG
jgi:hypothetical protein